MNITPENQKSSPVSYKDLVVWQKSMKFSVVVIDLAENLSQNKRHFRLIEQLEAADFSPNEHRRRQSRHSTKEYQHFLMIAREFLV